MTRLAMVVPADLTRPTGGNRYDLSLAKGLRDIGTEVALRPAPGLWPQAAAVDRELLASLLCGLDPVLVDGLVACGAPAEMAAAVAAGCRVHVLVHLPLALESGLSDQEAARLGALERLALRAATTVLATSQWAAADLRARHQLGAVAVASPGAQTAPLSPGSTPPRLLQLASVTPLKDQLTVVAALALVPDLPWSADLSGALDVDPGYTDEVRAAIDSSGVGDRIRLTGPLDGDALQEAWDAADLLLLPSRAETWGLVVTEALARGIPAVVSRATGAQEALGRAPDGSLPGATVPAGMPAALAAAIRHLLGPGREAARRAARQRRLTLRSWQDTARDVLAAMAAEVPQR